MGVRRYKVYGITLGSRVPLVSPLPHGSSEPDLIFDVVDERAPDIDLADIEPTYTEGRRSDGRPNFEFYSLADRTVIRIVPAMDFHLWPDRIICYLHLRDEGHLVEIALFGMVLSLWLELKGTRTLHASSVVIAGRAAVFASRRGGGKTSTAAGCVSAGHRLLSDDLVALDDTQGDICAHPGYPQLRLWPDEVSHFAGPPGDHPTFHPYHDKRRVIVGTGFGEFAAEAVPLGRLYIPERTDSPTSDVSIARMGNREAVMSLVRYSFLPREMVRLGLQPSRLAFFARLISTVQICRLTVPHGLDQLPRVVAAIEDDMQAMNQ